MGGMPSLIHQAGSKCRLRDLPECPRTFPLISRRRRTFPLARSTSTRTLPSRSFSTTWRLRLTIAQRARLQENAERPLPCSMHRVYARRSEFRSGSANAIPGKDPPFVRRVSQHSNRVPVSTVGAAEWQRAAEHALLRLTVGALLPRMTSRAVPLR